MITPCEKLGYKVGDKFRMLEDYHDWRKGETVVLVYDDGSVCPLFEELLGDREYYLRLEQVEKLPQVTLTAEDWIALMYWNGSSSLLTTCL